MNKDSILVDLIHSLTQRGRVITLSSDFTGMVTLAVDEDHTHCGYPHGPLKDCEKAIVHFLACKVEEIENE